jgi:hypothetical protein
VLTQRWAIFSHHGNVIQVHHSKAHDAPTVRFAFRSANGEAYIPVAGQWYNRDGPVTAAGN